MVDESLVNDLLEYFPEILHPNAILEIAKRVPLHALENRPSLETHQDLEQRKKWKIPESVLKRLEKLEHDWTSPTLLHHVPILYLDNGLFLGKGKSSSVVQKEDLEVPVWNWQDKSKCFPLVDTTATSRRCLTNDYSCQDRHNNKKGLRLTRAVVSRLSELDHTCSAVHVSLPAAEQIKKVHVQGYGKEITLVNYQTRFNTLIAAAAAADFVPSTRSTTAAAKRTTTQWNELDRFRFT